MRYYTIGEITRLGLLKKHKGEPYSDKATVSRIVSKMDFVEMETPWGKAKTVTKTQIDQHNKRWKSI